MTSLSCSESCIAQPVQYHCETNTLNLLWQQGVVTLGGSPYNITVVPKDGGGLSSNISFIAYSNNTTPIHCLDTTNVLDMDHYCPLIIGEFSRWNDKRSCINANWFIAPIPVVNNLMFDVLSNSSVTLHWTSPPVTLDCTTMYTVQVNLTDTDTNVLTKETNELAVNVSSLPMNTNYSYRVAGSDNVGRVGEWSDKQCFQLKGTY